MTCMGPALPSRQPPTMIRLRRLRPVGNRAACQPRYSPQQHGSGCPMPDGVVASVVEVVLRVSAEIATAIFGRAIGAVAGLGRSVRPQYGLMCLG